MGMGFALEAALRDAAQGARPGLKQSQIALCSSDVAGQDHRLPRGFYPFGSFDFPPGGDARNGFERASRASRLAAASSTRKMRRPSGTVTRCAGSGGSVLPSSTVRRMLAFSAPVTRNITLYAAFSTGRVRVMRRV